MNDIRKENIVLARAELDSRLSAFPVHKYNGIYEQLEKLSNDELCSQLRRYFSDSQFFPWKEIRDHIQRLIDTKDLQYGLEEDTLNLPAEWNQLCQELSHKNTYDPEKLSETHKHYLTVAKLFEKSFHSQFQKLQVKPDSSPNNVFVNDPVEPTEDEIYDNAIFGTESCNYWTDDDCDLDNEEPSSSYSYSSEEVYRSFIENPPVYEDYSP